MKRLIVNADDANLTPGVNRAILKCFDAGIVTSTTWIVNLPYDEGMVASFLKRKSLGIGLHLNVTLGRPVLPSLEAPSLISSDLKFKTLSVALGSEPEESELFAEYEAQILKFLKIFKRLPTHLDTHHHLHDKNPYAKVVMKLSKKYGLPVREAKCAKKISQGRTPRLFLGDLSVNGYWRKGELLEALSHLPQGVTEIMCHPGTCDATLQAISSFSWQREKETLLFGSKQIRKHLKRLGIKRVHFGSML